MYIVDYVYRGLYIYRGLYRGLCMYCGLYIVDYYVSWNVCFCVLSIEYEFELNLPTINHYETNLYHINHYPIDHYSIYFISLSCLLNYSSIIYINILDSNMDGLNHRQTRLRYRQREERTQHEESKESETETVLLSPNQSNEENTTKTARGRPKSKSKLPAITCGDGQHGKKVGVIVLELQHVYDVVINAMIDRLRQQIYSYLYHVVKAMRKMDDVVVPKVHHVCDVVMFVVLILP